MHVCTYNATVSVAITNWRVTELHTLLNYNNETDVAVVHLPYDKELIRLQEAGNYTLRPRGRTSTVETSGWEGRRDGPLPTREHAAHGMRLGGSVIEGVVAAAAVVDVVIVAAVVVVVAAHASERRLIDLPSY